MDSYDIAVFGKMRFAIVIRCVKAINVITYLIVTLRMNECDVE